MEFLEEKAIKQTSKVNMVERFTLDFWMDEGWYVGKLREVPGVFSQGESLEELKMNIQDAYDLMMQDVWGQSKNMNSEGCW